MYVYVHVRMCKSIHLYAVHLYVYTVHSMAIYLYTLLNISI